MPGLNDNQKIAIENWLNQYLYNNKIKTTYTINEENNYITITLSNVAIDLARLKSNYETWRKQRKAQINNDYESKEIKNKIIKSLPENILFKIANPNIKPNKLPNPQVQSKKQIIESIVKALSEVNPGISIKERSDVEITVSDDYKSAQIIVSTALNTLGLKAILTRSNPDLNISITRKDNFNKYDNNKTLEPSKQQTKQPIVYDEVYRMKSTINLALIFAKMRLVDECWWNSNLLMKKIDVLDKMIETLALAQTKDDINSIMFDVNEDQDFKPTSSTLIRNYDAKILNKHRYGCLINTTTQKNLVESFKQFKP